MKDFTIYYLFKMQPNALLISQNFIVVKSGCYNALDALDRPMVGYLLELY
jgi:hypothetical protein